jgi:hypothetical protein
MNKLKNRWQLDSLDEAQALLGRLMKYNDKALSLKHVDGDITGWFYQLIIFYQYAKISLIKYDEIAESAIYPSEMKDTIVKAHGAELEYVKAVSYHGCNFWIWRAFPHNSVAAYGSYHLWAIAGKKDGSFACYTYSTSPKFNIPSETIVARIEDADFIFGDLDEISLDQSGDIIYKTI